MPSEVVRARLQSVYIVSQGRLRFVFQAENGHIYATSRANCLAATWELLACLLGKQPETGRNYARSDLVGRSCRLLIVKAQGQRCFIRNVLPDDITSR